MHFVGSLLERDSREKYQAYRALVPRDGKFADFAAAYAQAYGEDLSEALAEMDGSTQDQGPWLCDGIVGAPMVIDGSTALLLAGECGDGDFFNPGTEEGELGASKVFMLDVMVGGDYELMLRGAGAPSMPYSLVITSCPGIFPSRYSGPSNIPWQQELWEGSYRVQVWYPGALEGAARLEVRLVHPFGHDR